VCVVDDVIGTEGSNQIHLDQAADAGHFRAERFGDLHGERAETALSNWSDETADPMSSR
jgi:hypothetical protein